MESQIKQLIVAKRLSQKEVAKAIGVTDQRLSNWINDVSYPRFKEAHKLAKYLGCSMDDLYEEGEEDSLHERKKAPPE
jgi:transcriptional regulator with XRE-family HTH domain